MLRPGVTVNDRHLLRGRGPRSLLLALVAIAIFGAQSFGLIHRVKHAEWLQPFVAWQAPYLQAQHGHPHGATAGQGNLVEHDAPEHDCAAIDALTLGDALAVTALAAAAVAPLAEGVACRFDSGHRRLAIGAFRARAPPALS